MKSNGKSVNSFKKTLNALKVIGAFLIFIIVLGIISTFNKPSFDSLTGDVSTRYIEMPFGKYAGDAILNTLSGQGSFYFDTGEIYEGSWDNNNMSGKGKFTYSSGKYDGDFSASQRSGKGTFTWDDGAMYNGDWASDKLNGVGTLISGQTSYEGKFKDNQFNEGTITITSENGTYKLNVTEGSLTGQASITFSSGVTYIGGFSGDKLSGTGTMTFPNIGKYEGSFSNGMRNGDGTFTWEDGVNYVGKWSDDKMNGEGTYNLNSTDYIKGTFVNGTLDGTYTYHNSKGNYKTTWSKNKNTGVTEE